MGVMEHINIRSSQIGVEKKENCKFTTLQVLNLLMLFPFFVVKNASRYSNSSLSKLFNCDKDMFYRFMNDGNVKWRKLLYNRFKKLKKSVLLLKDLLFPREIFIFALKWNCYEQI